MSPLRPFPKRRHAENSPRRLRPHVRFPRAGTPLTTDPTPTEPTKAFYEQRDEGSEYAPQGWHSLEPTDPLVALVKQFGLNDKKCLEIGCGRGHYQDLVKDYTGVDLAETVRPHLHKPFFAASAKQLPFPGDSFDAAWSVAVLEHIPDPEKALQEMRRVLRPRAILILAPAWQCRPWAADGYPVRSYSDFDLRGKLIKASIPLRDSVAWRSLHIFPRRAWRLAAWLPRRRPVPFRSTTLKANFDKFWMSDSDAVNSMDPFDAILWFVSRGDEVLLPPTRVRRFFVRTGALVIRIKPRG